VYRVPTALFASCPSAVLPRRSAVDGPSLVAAACVPPLLRYCSDAGHVQMEYEVAQCCMLATEQRSNRVGLLILYGITCV
jgi:hypothetical protein